MHVAYVARTQSSTLFLDADGVCLRVESHGIPATTDGAQRCIGAQYVASMDLTAAGGLAPLPKVGAPLLFGAVGSNGKIYIVRTGPLVAFEEVWSGVHARNELPLPPKVIVEDDPEAKTTPFRRGKASRPPLYVPPPVPTPVPVPTPEIILEEDDPPVSGDTFGAWVTQHGKKFVRRPSYEDSVQIEADTRPIRSTIPPPSPHLRRVTTPPPPPLRPIPITRVPPPPPSSQALTPMRRRPPMPSSHAWLRESSAAAAPMRLVK
jgi:hypothetical protein